MTNPEQTPAQAPPADTTRYFALAISLSWVALIAPVLAELGVLEGAAEEYMALAPLAVFSPTIAAMIATRLEGGPVRSVFAGLRAWRVGPKWYVLALTLPAIVYTAGRAVCELLPGVDGGPWFYPPVEPQHIAALVLVPLGEEIGWRGYALPRLIARHGSLRATWYLGALWGLWHLPMFLAVGMTPLALALAVPFFLAGNVMFTWLYQRTGGSLVMAVLLHMGLHLDNPHHAPPEFITPMVIMTLSYVVLAALLLGADRRAFDVPVPAA